MPALKNLCCLLLVAACALASVAAAAKAAASAGTTDQLAGSIEANLDGRKVVLTALNSAYQITINGDVANVKLTQTFSNPYKMPLNAKYLFPLNRQAAVHAMTMRVGNEEIRAQIQEIEKAKQTFAKAKEQGKAAALLEQHRPNMFTQKIANLMPGLAIEVEIEYAQIVPRIDGAYELVVPMVVGPRFQPAGAGVAPVYDDAGATPNFGKWQLEALPAYPSVAGVHLPSAIVSERVSMVIDLEAPVTLQAVYSNTHELAIRHVSSTQQEITFAKNKVLDNKDFVLRYDLAGTSESAGLLSHWEADEGGYFSLLIEPPAIVAEDRAMPREMVFLLDCSGSMSGLPMSASKRFMTQALKALRPTDTFRIIRFSDAATAFSATALPATTLNIEQGLRYTRNLYGSGGTMMTSGIRQALRGPVASGTVRNVVFLTDGYIGNEVSVLELVQNLLGDSRLYAFGVGAGVNRYLMDELGRVGRGFTRYFDPTRDDESMEAVVADLVAKLQTPVLTDLNIDWGGLAVNNVVPAKLPDLYAGNSIRVTGRFSAPAAGEVTISGTGASQVARIVQAVDLTREAARPAVRRVWARTAIAELMHGFITPPALRPDAMSNQQLQASVTDLGLTYGLATRWTAFVAVSRQRYNSTPDGSVDADVTLPKVAGVSNLAYAQPAMTGYGAPEPGMWLGMVVAMLAWGWWWRNKVGAPVPVVD